MRGPSQRVCIICGTQQNTTASLGVVVVPFFFFYGIVLPTAWQAGLIAFSAIREVIFATLRDELSSATIELVEQGYLLVVLT